MEPELISSYLVYDKWSEQWGLNKSSYLIVGSNFQQLVADHLKSFDYIMIWSDLKSYMLPGYGARSQTVTSWDAVSKAGNSCDLLYHFTTTIHSLKCFWIKFSDPSMSIACKTKLPRPSMKRVGLRHLKETMSSFRGLSEFGDVWDSASRHNSLISTQYSKNTISELCSPCYKCCSWLIPNYLSNAFLNKF